MGRRQPDDAVRRIDPATNAVATTIAVGRSPAAIAVGAGSVWVANGGDGTVSRIDPKTNRIVDTVRVGGSPQGIVVGAGRVWVTVQAAAAALPVSWGGTLRVGVSTSFAAPYESIDPAIDYDTVGWQIESATCAKLLNYPDRPAPAGSIPQPEVARALPRVSSDRRTYTFTIGPGFRFSPPSNEQVTAASFKFAIERSLSPRLGSSAAARTSGFLDDVVGVKAYEAGRSAHVSGVVARGDRLAIKLTAAAPSLLARLAMPFFCAVPTNTPTDSHGAVIASAGPYYISSYTPKQQLVLKRNPNYTGRRPHRLDRILFTLGASPAKTVSQIEAGSIDYADFTLPSADYVRLAARYGPGIPDSGARRPQLLLNPKPILWYYALNTSRPLFASARQRRAVNYAVGRRALAQQGSTRATNPLLTLLPTDQYLPIGLAGSPRTSIYPLDGNVAEARRLARGRHGRAVLYTCIISPCPQQAQVLKRNLKAIGLDLEVKQFPFSALGARLGRRGEPYDLAFAGWVADYLDPSDFLNPLLDGAAISAPTHNNYALFDDPVTNRKLREAARLLGPKRYRAYGKLALDLARNEAPLIAYGTESSPDFFSARVGCQVYQPAYGVDLAALCLPTLAGARLEDRVGYVNPSGA